MGLGDSAEFIYYNDFWEYTPDGICTTGTEELLADNLPIEISPNPATNTLLVNTNSNEPSELILYDITSRKILEANFTATLSLNIESLAQGIYLYEIRTKEGVLKNGKIIKGL